MATSIKQYKEKYKDFSIEDIEKEYEHIKEYFNFNTKEDKIKFIIKYNLNAGFLSSIQSKKEALEELLKQKTGITYKIEPTEFDITLADVINVITNYPKDIFWTKTFLNFMNNIEGVSEQEKIKFLIDLVQSKTLFDEFAKEILQNSNDKTIFEKYKMRVKEYCIRNSVK